LQKFDTVLKISLTLVKLFSTIDQSYLPIGGGLRLFDLFLQSQTIIVVLENHSPSDSAENQGSMLLNQIGSSF